jgi:hypothetical protein
MERRKQTRHPANFDVRLSFQEFQDIKFNVSNFSDDGIYIVADGHDLPNLGAVVQVQLDRPVSLELQAPVLDMVIRRVDIGGLGLQYLGESKS